MVVERSDRVAIITVHGTADTGGTTGEKWFQIGSAFVGRLCDRLKAHGVEAEIFPHQWSGRNSVRSRERSAERLTKTIRRCARTHASVHVIGHSHGGNVANEAACMVGWPDRGAQRTLSSVTTVGTPFFRGEVSRMEWWGAIAFLFFAVVTSIGVPLAVVSLVENYSHLSAHDAQVQASDIARRELAHASPPVTEAAVEVRTQELLPEIEEMFEAKRHQIQGWWAVGVASVGSLFFVVPLAWQGARRVRRLRSKPRTDALIHSIWHEHDEAMSFLRATEQMKFEAFPKWSLWRGTRTLGVVWGARMVLLVVILSVIISVLGYLGISPNPNAISLSGFDAMVRYIQRTPGGELVAVSIAVAPVVFVVTYFLARFFSGLAPELLARDAANNRIRRIVRAVAFGKDGDERIGSVSPRSHSFGTKDGALPTELSERMRADAAVGADDLLRKYRWELFNLSVDGSLVLRRIQADIATWKSLIHTTYFEQPEIADMIGDHIAAESTRANELAKRPQARGRGPLAAAGLRAGA